MNAPDSKGDLESKSNVRDVWNFKRAGMQYEQADQRSRKRSGTIASPPTHTIEHEENGDENQKEIADLRCHAQPKFYCVEQLIR